MAGWPLQPRRGSAFPPRWTCSASRCGDAEIGGIRKRAYNRASFSSEPKPIGRFTMSFAGGQDAESGGLWPPGDRARQLRLAATSIVLLILGAAAFSIDL